MTRLEQFKSFTPEQFYEYFEKLSRTWKGSLSEFTGVKRMNEGTCIGCPYNLGEDCTDEYTEEKDAFCEARIKSTVIQWLNEEGEL